MEDDDDDEYSSTSSSSSTDVDINLRRGNIELGIKNKRSVKLNSFDSHDALPLSQSSSKVTQSDVASSEEITSEPSPESELEGPKPSIKHEDVEDTYRFSHSEILPSSTRFSKAPSHILPNTEENYITVNGRRIKIRRKQGSILAADNSILDTTSNLSSSSDGNYKMPGITSKKFWSPPQEQSSEKAGKTKRTRFLTFDADEKESHDNLQKHSRFYNANSIPNTNNAAFKTACSTADTDYKLDLILDTGTAINFSRHPSFADFANRERLLFENSTKNLPLLNNGLFRMGRKDILDYHSDNSQQINTFEPLEIIKSSAYSAGFESPSTALQDEEKELKEKPSAGENLNTKIKEPSAGSISEKLPVLDLNDAKIVQSPKKEIQNPNKGIQNPKKGKQNPKKGIQNPKKGIQKSNNIALNSSFTLMSADEINNWKGFLEKHFVANEDLEDSLKLSAVDELVENAVKSGANEDKEADIDSKRSPLHDILSNSKTKLKKKKKKKKKKKSRKSTEGDKTEKPASNGEIQISKCKLCGRHKAYYYCKTCDKKHYYHHHHYHYDKKTKEAKKMNKKGYLKNEQISEKVQTKEKKHRDGTHPSHHVCHDCWQKAPKDSNVADNSHKTPKAHNRVLRTKKSLDVEKVEANNEEHVNVSKRKKKEPPSVFNNSTKPKIKVSFNEGWDKEIISKKQPEKPRSKSNVKKHRHKRKSSFVEKTEADKKNVFKEKSTAPGFDTADLIESQETESLVRSAEPLASLTPVRSRKSSSARMSLESTKKNLQDNYYNLSAKFHHKLNQNGQNTASKKREKGKDNKSKKIEIQSFSNGESGSEFFETGVNTSFINNNLISEPFPFIFPTEIAQDGPTSNLEDGQCDSQNTLNSQKQEANVNTLNSQKQEANVNSLSSRAKTFFRAGGRFRFNKHLLKKIDFKQTPLADIFFNS